MQVNKVHSFFLIIDRIVDYFSIIILNMILIFIHFGFGFSLKQKCSGLTKLLWNLWFSFSLGWDFIRNYWVWVALYQRSARSLNQNAKSREKKLWIIFPSLTLRWFYWHKHFITQLSPRSENESVKSFFFFKPAYKKSRDLSDLEKMVLTEAFFTTQYSLHSENESVN